MKTNIGAILFGCALMAVVSTNAFGQKSGDSHGQHKGEGKDKHKASGMYDNRGNFSTRIYRVTQADSLQKPKMKPVLDKTALRLEALRASYAKQEKIIMDSLSLQLKPILKDEQMKKLNDYVSHQNGRTKK